MSNQEQTPKGAYRIVREGLFDYWVQKWSGTEWTYAWPFSFKFTAVWFVMNRKEEKRLEEEKAAKSVVVWQE